MKQFNILKRIRLHAIVLFTLLSGYSAFGQSVSSQANNFWLAFEKCTQITELQNRYPTISSSTTREHTVMLHGVEIPSNQGVTFTQNNTFELLGKSGILSQQKTHFFILHEARVNDETAVFDLVYYYNFNGSYDSFVAALVTLNKVNGVWTVTQTQIK